MGELRVAQSRAHKATANRIAAKYKTQYNQGPGADIKTSNIAVEVETEDTIGDAARQLRGHTKPSYVAVTNQRSVQKALDHYADTTIGVMDPSGKIVKRSTRKKK